MKHQKISGGGFCGIGSTRAIDDDPGVDGSDGGKIGGDSERLVQMVDGVRQLTEEQEQKPVSDSSSTTVTPTNDDIYIYIYQDSSRKMVRHLAPTQLTGCLEKPCSNVGSKLLIANHIFNEWLFNPYTCSQIEKVRSDDA